MRTPRAYRSAALFVAATGLVSCLGDVTDPGGGGMNTDPRRCTTNWTRSWSDNQLAINVTQPPCPFTVRDEWTFIDYVALITAPRAKIMFDVYGRPESYINAEAMDWYTASRIASASFVYFQQDPGDQNMFRAEPRMSGRPGTYKVPGNPAQMLDSLHADAVFMAVGGFSQGWKILPGNITSVSQTVLGSDNVPAGAVGTWRSQPHWDTTAYTYRWLVDGTEIAGALGARHDRAFESAGTYRLTNVTIRTDETRDTVTRTITVTLNGAISGPTQIPSEGQYAWTVTGSGSSTGVYSYVWERVAGGNSQIVSTSSSYSDYIGPSDGSFTLRVTVRSSGYPDGIVSRFVENLTTDCSITAC